LTALGAMCVLKKAGLQIPQDISIVGFDDIALALLSEPALTTVSVRIPSKLVESQSGL